MDSITQIVLAASFTAAIAPAENRRAALLAGAALGTLPDLDSFPLILMTDNPVALMTEHRGPTHSLLMLPLIGLLIWWLCKRFGRRGRVRAEPRRWFWAIQAALFTHPLIDACTVYGTQLWWPFTPHPAMWASLFIIDPLYTIWLLLGCSVALIAGARPIAQVALVAGLVISSLYLTWSFVAKAQADHAAQEALAALGHADAPYFSVPAPLNTLLWRSVVMTDDGFLEGERSLIADEGPTQFKFYPSDTEALAAVQDFPDVQRLLWFNRGFMKAQVVDEPESGGQVLVLSDIRMGNEPNFFFNFAVAKRTSPEAAWEEIAPRRVALNISRRERWSLGKIWQRVRGRTGQ